MGRAAARYNSPMATSTTPTGWSPAQLRHLAAFFGLRRIDAPTVYNSIGADFLAAPAPGFLNLGLWDTRPGTVAGAPAAAARLVTRLADALPRGGVVLDVANGLGAQDELIAGMLRPRQLVAVNLTESQLRAGGARLAAAGAQAVCGDATRLPLASGVVDGLISVEAAFHFPSRAAFFAEAARVLRPGGVLSFSDVSVERMAWDPLSLAAGLTNTRFWGIHPGTLARAGQIAGLLRAAGFAGVVVERVGHDTIDPFCEFLDERLAAPDAAGLPSGQRRAGAVIAAQWRHLRARGVLDYLLVRAHLPG